MCKLKPLLQRWLQDADAGLTPASMSAAANGSSIGAGQSMNGGSLNGSTGTSGLNSLAGAGANSGANHSMSSRSNGAGNGNIGSGMGVGLGAFGSAGSLLNSPMLSSNEAMCKRRKKRTSIDAHIRVSLEKAFIYNQKPSLEEISSLAEKIKMDKEVVGHHESIQKKDLV